jgi:DNA-damage-inducible protein J
VTWQSYSIINNFIMSSTIQVRIKDSKKKAAKKVFDTIGIDMSSAIKLYLHQVVITQSIPFKIVTENRMTPKQEAEILKASREAKQGKNAVRANSWKEAKALLDSWK